LHSLHLAGLAGAQENKNMKFLRPMLSVALLIAAVTLIVSSNRAFAQTQSDAQKAFDNLKSLAGTWKGTLTTNPPQPEWEGKPIWVILRVTSRGNVLIHEMKEPGTPDDTSKDDPVTMLYLDNDRLTLVHYCDAGNRPRMIAKTSTDGKQADFSFVDLSGGNENGHMHHAAFSVIDTNHHIEDWTFMMPGDKPVQVHLDLQRVK
jgi:hypothetical protein